MAILGQLQYQCHRLARSAHHQQLIVDELASHIERLETLDSVECREAVKQLHVSELLKSKLEEPTLEGEVIEDEDGSRVVLSLQWRRPIDAPPVKLVSWLRSTGRSKGEGGNP